MNISIRRRDLGLAAAGWCSGCAGPVAAAPSADSDDARTYRALRQIRGHFDGGRWSDDIDRWQGRKHLAMLNLAGELEVFVHLIVSRGQLAGVMLGDGLGALALE